MALTLGNRQAVIGRELTKKFEEYCRGTLTTLTAEFSARLPKGEFTLVVAGSQKCGTGHGQEAVGDPW
jgi:16S rRNA (cytidine1402-2'-O)-methyltransferase